MCGFGGSEVVGNTPAPVQEANKLNSSWQEWSSGDIRLCQTYKSHKWGTCSNRTFAIRNYSEDSKTQEGQGSGD